MQSAHKRNPVTITETDPNLIFAYARRMHSSALDRMTAGDIRDAAEKALCATLRATEALVLARTGQSPTTSTAGPYRRNRPPLETSLRPAAVCLADNLKTFHEAVDQRISASPPSIARRP